MTELQHVSGVSCEPVTELPHVSCVSTEPVTELPHVSDVSGVEPVTEIVASLGCFIRG